MLMGGALPFFGHFCVPTRGMVLVEVSGLPCVFAKLMRGFLGIPAGTMPEMGLGADLGAGRAGAFKADFKAGLGGAELNMAVSWLPKLGWLPLTFRALVMIQL